MASIIIHTKAGVSRFEAGGFIPIFFSNAKVFLFSARLHCYLAAPIVVVLGMHKGPHLRFDHPAQTEGRNCHVVEEERKRWSPPVLSIRFLRLSPSSPREREREAGVHKWQRKEDERVEASERDSFCFSGPLSPISSFFSFWTESIAGGRTRQTSDTLLVVSVDKYNRRTDSL